MHEELKNKISALLKTTGFLLWDFRFTRDGIHIFADKEAGNISIDDCSKISESINFLLQNEMPQYAGTPLTVSSPGINRRLLEKWHFERALGRKIIVITNVLVEKNSYFTGFLRELSESSVTIEKLPAPKSSIGKNVIIEFSKIKEARLNEI